MISLPALAVTTAHTRGAIHGVLAFSSPSVVSHASRSLLAMLVEVMASPKETLSYLSTDQRRPAGASSAWQPGARAASSPMSCPSRKQVISNMCFRRYSNGLPLHLLLPPSLLPLASPSLSLSLAVIRLTGSLTHNKVHAPRT